MLASRMSVFFVIACLGAPTVWAQDRIAPTAVLDAPTTVQVGTALTLSAARSSDVGGRIVRYIWIRTEGVGGAMTPGMAFGTLDSSYLVPQGPGNLLSPGRHRFQLMVEDDSGNRSKPIERVVIVTDEVAPTAVAAGPAAVTQMQPFQLSGEQSFDADGRIVQFEWTRVTAGEGPMPPGAPIRTTASSINISQSPTSYLGVGRHVFRLVVTDDAGNKSRPTDIAIEVAAPLRSGRSK